MSRRQQQQYSDEEEEEGVEEDREFGSDAGAEDGAAAAEAPPPIPPLGLYNGPRDPATGARSGVGARMRFANGDSYEGDYSDGVRSGHGTYTFANGASYDGFYAAGVRNGRGVLTLPVAAPPAPAGGKQKQPPPPAQDPARFEGEWKEGKREGNGVHRYANGDVYDGAWTGDAREGAGAYTYAASGVVSHGQWRAGSVTGVARVSWPDGTIYVGAFDGGRAVGRGAFYSPEGVAMAGEFLADGTWVAEPDEDRAAKIEVEFPKAGLKEQQVRVAPKKTGDAKLDELVSNWVEWDINEGTREEILTLAADGNVAELKSRLLKRIAFGTAGLRGPMKAGFSCMNALTVMQASQGLCASVSELVQDAQKKGVVVGYDGRHHSREFAEITARVFLSKGYKVLLYSRIVPTPFVPFAVTHLKCAAGVMVTASHNPKQDNGYKVYWENGCQIVSPIDAHIAKKIEANLKPWDLSSAPSLAASQDPLKEVMGLYYAAMMPLRAQAAQAPPPQKVTYTAMHGVGADYVRRSFEAFGLEPYIGVSKQLQPDPEFSTVIFPNPEEGREALDLGIETANAQGSNLILATDPDADRLAVAQRAADGTWRLFTGNEIGILLGWWAWQNFRALNPGVAPADCVVLTTAVSSRMLSAFARAEGLTFQETLTGFKWLGTAAFGHIKAGRRFVFAFEEAIGFMLGDMSLDKDGVRAAAVFADMSRTLGRDGLTAIDQLGKLYAQYGYHATCNRYFFCYDPAVLEAIFARLRKDGAYHKEIGRWKVKNVRDLTIGFDNSQPGNKPVLPVSASTQMITYTFENGCTATLRGSGTEPKLKYYIELPGRWDEREKVDAELAEMVAAVIAECLRPTENGLKPPSS